MKRDKYMGMDVQQATTVVAVIVVKYNPVKTNGLTAENIIEAISTRCGPATTPGDSVSVSDSTTFEDQEKVLARWDNEQYSYKLSRSLYGRTFGLVAFSKTLDLKVRNANREADRWTSWRRQERKSRSRRNARRTPVLSKRLSGP